MTFRICRIIVTFRTCRVIVLVVYLYLLCDRDLSYLTFAPRTKPLASFPSSQNTSYKVLFVAIPRGRSFLGLNRSQANVEKIMRQDSPRRSS